MKIFPVYYLVLLVSLSASPLSLSPSVASFLPALLFSSIFHLETFFLLPSFSFSLSSTGVSLKHTAHACLIPVLLPLVLGLASGYFRMSLILLEIELLQVLVFGSLEELACVFKESASDDPSFSHLSYSGSDKS